ncbi:ribosome small subunit-dependent GTPase A [Peptoniphilus equinus]|uniref:Small ribosomal subunit biogenesis GTPase RsgA n=1 Tax=Peptoniphilus equinus TaxID=3016343 RepID=A0ABY7QR34_9FIRM|nr:ribosome small subunit-dependent GTPase A [Peptoniphilus equinus]WBW49249.1 ribosome small subunit-dependent GTPase A [Peptoniphilus equinus]
MEGKIIKLTGGFYTVLSEDIEYTARARGNFRNEAIKPIVGDNVVFRMENDLGYITEVLPRHNVLKRPQVANVDQVLVVIPTKDPQYNLNLVDKVIASYEDEVDILIAINKYDLDKDSAEHLLKIYRGAGFKTFLISYKYTFTIDLLREYVRGKTTALSGVSAAGKSTIISNLLGKEIKVGGVSEKTRRGVHTTRHVEIFSGSDATFIFDTPGFSSMKLDIGPADLHNYYREFRKYKEGCRFMDCKHIHEPDCAVKEAVMAGMISEERYDTYLQIYNELSDEERK